MSVHQLPSGLWQARWNDRHPNGKRWQRFESFKTKTEAIARERLGIVEAHQRARRELHSELRTVTNLIEHFRTLARYEQLAAETKVRYEQLITHFVSYCKARGLVFLSQWGRDEARRYESWVYGKFSGKGVVHVIALTKALFAEELLRDRPSIPENPFLLIKPKQPPRKDIRIFEAEELELIFRESYESHRHIWRTLLFTGIRSGEWRHFPPQHFVNGGFKIDAIGDWKPKTFKGRRFIPNVVDPVREAVEYFGTVNAGQPYLFSGAKPKYKGYLVEMYNSVANRIRRKYRMPLEGTHVHCFRYTFGSSLLQMGVPIEVVSDLMGHEDIQTTQRIYAKLSHHNLYEGMERLKSLSTKGEGFVNQK